MITRNEVRVARIAEARAAGLRWQKRQAEREENLRRIRADGVGAADSTDRQIRFAARESVRRAAAVRHRAGTLPAALERIIGPTVDLIDYPPSEAARVAGRPVARIVVMPGAGLVPEGIATGFMVSSRLLLTNWHVLPSRDSANGLGANFLFERVDRGVQQGTFFELKPEEFYLASDAFDFAVVAVAAKSLDGRSIEEFGSVRLIEATPKILNGQPVNIIQHPGGMEKKYATMENRLLDVLPEGFLHYTTDTLPGSSGSPAFNQMWELVALHHSGVPEMRDGEIWSKRGGPWDPESMTDDEVNWIANEGARVSVIVGELGRARMETASEQALLDELLKTTMDPLEAAATVTEASAIPPQGTKANITIEGKELMGTPIFNFTGPVTIHVHATTAQAAAVAASAASGPPTQVVAVEKTIRFDTDYDAKTGYDEDFLGGGGALKVPMPKVAAARMGELFMDHQRPNESYVFKYHHYSLVMNKARRLLMWSAVNVDYSPERRDDRSRKELGTDKWIPDPRLPIKFQITDPEFYQPAGNIDRGHIVRREDSAWGESPDDIEFSNSDTFHWTNCTPQHEVFNQENPKGYSGRKGIWGEFEAWVQKQILQNEQRCCILAGPVLAARDPSANFGSGRIKYPIRFWKVIVVSADDGGARKLKAYGFVFSQADVVREFGIEFVPGRFARFQKKLTEITALSGVEFDATLLAADTKQ